ncbi:MAG: ECF-type sigma factor [Planctomycetota bacterium]
MNEVTRILRKIEDGDPAAASHLLPLVYDELRKLAAARLRGEMGSNSLQPTMLVHDAYIRLVDQDQPQAWNGRGHFFGAAAEAMRRLLIEYARQRKSLKRGGDLQRVELEEIEVPGVADQIDLLALEKALTQLETMSAGKAKLVKLRFFAGLTVPEAAQVMGISVATAERNWKFARTWLYAKLNPDQ